MADQAQAVPRTRRGELTKESAKTELRPGIGLCDQCMEPRWPQKYVGYGIMLCEDCQTSKPKETPMTIVRTEYSACFLNMPAVVKSGAGDYARIVVELPDGTEKEIWRGSKWTKKDHEKKKRMER